MNEGVEVYRDYINISPTNHEEEIKIIYTYKDVSDRISYHNSNGIDNDSKKTFEAYCNIFSKDILDIKICRALDGFDGIAIFSDSQISFNLLEYICKNSRFIQSTLAAIEENISEINYIVNSYAKDTVLDYVDEKRN